jgi:hypothetical protein
LVVPKKDSSVGSAIAPPTIARRWINFVGPAGSIPNVS